jgi:hypothetical protein
VEPSDWIALAAVGATAVTIVVAYFQAKDSRRHTERLARVERKHARQVARDDRMFDARRSAYEGVLELLQHRWETVKAFRQVPGMEEGSSLEPFAQDELAALRARLGLYASEAVLARFYEFLGALRKLASAIGQLAAAREHESIANEESKGQLRERFPDYADSVADTLSKRSAVVDEADQDVRAHFEAISRVMQEHLEGRADPE